MAETGHPRILIVDDASLIRLYYREALEPAGFEVDEALNGLEALEKLLTAPADLLIVDINMPQMDGLSFLRALRRQALPVAAIPAIVASTEAGPQDIEAARVAGANFYLTKPMSQAVLVEYARMLCGAPMNEFLEQFLIECRELVEQATADLLSLEEDPLASGPLDSAFRAFHTLKGAAGIVDFTAMGQLLHAAEEVLSSVRKGDLSVTQDLVSDCLTCLDQIVQWLDAMETSGEPPADADASAAVLIGRFGRGGPAAPAAPAEAAVADTGWLDRLLAGEPQAAARARVALRYAPDPDCFFRGEDPLAQVAALPGLLAVRLEPAHPWPTLDALDPFSCNLVILALATGSAEAAARHLRPVADRVTVVPMAGDRTAGDAVLPGPVRGLLEEQLKVLDLGGPTDFAGRFGSIGQVVRGLLGHLGWAERLGGLDAAMRAAQATGDKTALAAFVRRMLDGADEPDEAAPDTPPVSAPQDASTRSLRVDVERVDHLVRLAGELTVVKNAIGHAARLAQSGGDPAALAAILKDQQLLLDRLAADLQQSVLAIRVLPVRHVFQRFPRLVREMAASLGKPAKLVTEGDATEADKAIVETLFEPLLHVVRNAMDHGVETPDRRRALGKPEVATIRLRAVREGEAVIVEASDDGGGVDLVRVREVAVARGVASAEAVTTLGDAEVADLIFAPGFSTARTVTDLSGRGVGMDAVRAAVERMGGRVSFASTPGQGSQVRFVLPFTVMMTRVMTVEVGGQVFGAPFEAVVETVRVARDRIVPLGAGEAFVLRNTTMPVLNLAETLGLPLAPRGDEVNLIVASASGHLGALEVDRFGDRLDVMLKPMDGILSGAPGLAGTALLGDGRVLIVLDLWDLLR